MIFVLCGWYTFKWRIFLSALSPQVPFLHWQVSPSKFVPLSYNNVINLSTQKIWMIINIHGSVKVTLRQVVTLISLELRVWISCFILCFTQCFKYRISIPSWAQVQMTFSLTALVLSELKSLVKIPVFHPWVLHVWRQIFSM